MAGRAEFQGLGRLSVHVTVRARCPGGCPLLSHPPACVSSWCCCLVVRACSSLS